MNYCGAYHPKECTCSLEKGHKGNHIAYTRHDNSKEIIAEWPKDQYFENPFDCDLLD